MGEGSLQRSDRFFNQSGSVVKRNDTYFRYCAVGQCFLGQTGFYLFDLCLYVIDHLQRVCSIAGNDDSSYSFHSFFIQSATPCTGADSDESDIRDTHRHAVPNCYDCLFQIGYIFNITEPADQVFYLVYFHRLGTDIEITFLHRIHDLHDRHIKGTHGVRIQFYLIFLHETSG